MSVIYLIRHGKTAANEQHLYCGSSDLPLSEAGKAALAPLSLPESCRYLTSGMLRTEQTLALLFGDVPHEADPRLREMDFGSFELRSYQELKDDPAYLQWITGDNEKNITPGGESGEMMTSRVLAAFSEIRSRGQDTVIVTHGGVIAAIMADLFPNEGKNRYEWQPKPGCGYRIADGHYISL